MDAGEYKHVALGLIFLKYISDALQEWYDEIKKEPRRSRGPGRVHERERLLGASRGPLGEQLVSDRLYEEEEYRIHIIFSEENQTATGFAVLG